MSKAQFRLIGQDIPRADIPGKQDGSTKYSIDVQVPGMIYGAILREPVEGAGVASVDDKAARAIDGVINVVTLKNGVGVLAENPWAAFQGRKALKVTWGGKAQGAGFSTDGGYAQFSAAAKDPAHPVIDWEKRGDAVGKINSAANVVEAEYRSDYAYHAQMEPLNSVAAVSPAGDAVEIWCGVQSQTIAVTVAAQALGIPESKVKFNHHLLGGGFGRRGNRDALDSSTESSTKSASGKPVKVMWTREDDIHSGRFRPLYVNRLRAGLDASGNVIGYHHRAVCDHVMAFMDPVRYKQVKGRDGIALNGIGAGSYEIADRVAEGVLVHTGMRTNPLRGIGFTANSFATEVFIDELAAKAGVDPVEFRLRMLQKDPRGRHVIRAKIGEIRGEFVDMAEARARAREAERRTGRIFMVAVSERRAVDATRSTDPLRFANHACEPNMVLKVQQGRVAFYALRDIAAGEILAAESPLESAWVLLRGAAEVEFAGHRAVVARADIFEEPPTALHLPRATAATDLAGLVQTALHTIVRRSLIFLVSDFFSAPGRERKNAVRMRMVKGRLSAV